MWRKVKWFVLGLAVVIVGVIGYYGYSFYQFGSNIQAKDDDPLLSQFKPQQTSQIEEAPPKWEGRERVNILLLGADARSSSKNTSPRSDTILIASIDPVTKKASLFSILRDTYVSIPGHGQDRINAAFSIGGPNLTMKTVSEFLGIPIQYYVYTDFQGFVALVDAIGGIEIDVEKDMKYHDSEEPELDINLKKGLQHMDGKTALQYVRFRHDALSDYSRTERQRKFLTAVAQKLQSTTSILRLPSILNKIDPYITTNLSITDMIKLGSLGFEVRASGVNSQQIPPSHLLQETNIGGASVLTVNKQKLQQFVKEQLEGTESSGSMMYADGDADKRASAIKSGSTSASGSSGKSGATAAGSSGSKSGSSSSGTKSGTTGASSGAGTGTASGGSKSSGTGSGSTTNGSKSSGTGSGTTTDGNKSSGTGSGSTTNGSKSSGTGSGTTTDGNKSSGTGSGSTTNGSKSSGTGSGTTTDGNKSSGTGSGTATGGNKSSGAGTGTTTGGDKSSGAGTGTTTGGDKSAATGTGTTTGGDKPPSASTESGTKSGSGTNGAGSTPGTSGAGTGSASGTGTAGSGNIQPEGASASGGSKSTGNGSTSSGGKQTGTGTPSAGTQTSVGAGASAGTSGSSGGTGGTTGGSR
jgi:LCP family protein required for cell wall assembly